MKFHSFLSTIQFIEKIEVIIDTLKAQAKNSNFILEASIKKSNKKKQKKKNK